MCHKKNGTERNVKMNTVTANKSPIQFLREAYAQAQDIRIHYTLYEINTSYRTYYAAEIFTDEDSSMQILGQAHDDAQQLFESLIRYTVTPCTLSDILREIDILKGEQVSA